MPSYMYLSLYPIGLLRNLSFEKDDYLKEMLTQGYVPLLLDVCIVVCNGIYDSN